MAWCYSVGIGFGIEMGSIYCANPHDSILRPSTVGNKCPYSERFRPITRPAVMVGQYKLTPVVYDIAALNVPVYYNGLSSLDGKSDTLPALRQALPETALASGSLPRYPPTS